MKTVPNRLAVKARNFHCRRRKSLGLAPGGQGYPGKIMNRLVPSDPGMLVAGSARMTVLKTPVSIGVGGLRLLEQIFPYDNEQDHDDCDARKRERARFQEHHAPSQRPYG